MKPKILSPRPLLAVAALGVASMLFAPLESQASLIDDDILGCQSGFGACAGFGSPGRFDALSAVVADPGIEFTATFEIPGGVFFATATADFDASSLSIVWQAATAHSNIGQEFAFGDLDWVGMPGGGIVDVVERAGATLPVQNLLFTDDSITIQFANFNFTSSGEVRSITFDIVADAVVPVAEPVGTGGLLLLGLALARRRRPGSGLERPGE